MRKQKTQKSTAQDQDQAQTESKARKTFWQSLADDMREYHGSVAGLYARMCRLKKVDPVTKETSSYFAFPDNEDPIRWLLRFALKRGIESLTAFVRSEEADILKQEAERKALLKGASKDSEQQPAGELPAEEIVDKPEQAIETESAAKSEQLPESEPVAEAA